MTSNDVTVTSSSLDAGRHAGTLCLLLLCPMDGTAKCSVCCTWVYMRQWTRREVGVAVPLALRSTVRVSYQLSTVLCIYSPMAVGVPWRWGLHVRE